MEGRRHPVVDRVSRKTVSVKRDRDTTGKGVSVGSITVTQKDENGLQSGSETPLPTIFVTILFSVPVLITLNTDSQ